MIHVYPCTREGEKKRDCKWEEVDDFTSLVTVMKLPLENWLVF